MLHFSGNTALNAAAAVYTASAVELGGVVSGALD
jgi:hypothetical protein